jgi:hypothetical protein
MLLLSVVQCYKGGRRPAHCTLVRAIVAWHCDYTQVLSRC